MCHSVHEDVKYSLSLSVAEAQKMRVMADGHSRAALHFLSRALKTDAVSVSVPLERRYVPASLFALFKYA